jgi:hypothetical protein
VVPLRLVALVTAVALAGCGVDDSSPQLVDGTRAETLPAELADLDDAVMTRVTVVQAGEVSDLAACDLAPESELAEVVERVGLRGSSVTFVHGTALYGCNAIPGPPVLDPDDPGDGVWCSGAAGRLDADGLNDPRLSLCQDADSNLTAFAWVEPDADAKWLVVSDAGTREVYEVAAGLPVRVTTTDDVELESSRASFEIEEYAADGAKLREYVLEAVVAG